MERSVASCVKGERLVAVAYSGGLDSSVLVACAKRHSEVLACSAFAEGSVDSTRASRGAGLQGVQFLRTVITREKAEEMAEGVDLSVAPSLMDRSLWCIYSAASRCARDNGAKVILLGQLADELFGGYAKYQRALEAQGEGAAEEMMSRDVSAYPRKGLRRDVDACASWVEPRFPFMAREVMDFGLALPVGFKLREGVRKAVLRRAAEMLGVPGELAGAGKKAAQYSSGVQKALRRLTLLSPQSGAGL
jgi:asparagine synthase (glutamine-hydrolysing)